MKLSIIHVGEFLVDGGAMFGVVPKTMWQKYYPANEQNLCKIALRSLIIEEDDRVFLIDNGCGDKLHPRFYQRNSINQDVSLLRNMERAGYRPKDITDIILTHLHFDHCGGSTYRNEDGELQVTFPNAQYHTSTLQWENMMNPGNIREGSAMFKDDLVPVFKAGQLVLHNEATQFTPNVGFEMYYGHTLGQMIPWIKYQNKILHFVADLVPLACNIPTAWVAAYDCFPMTTMDEKVEFLKQVQSNNDLLFFQHDYYIECCEVEKTFKGFRVGRKGMLEELLG